MIIGFQGLRQSNSLEIVWIERVRAIRQSVSTLMDLQSDEQVVYERALRYSLLKLKFGEQYRGQEVEIRKEFESLASLISAQVGQLEKTLVEYKKAEDATDQLLSHLHNMHNYLKVFEKEHFTRTNNARKVFTALDRSEVQQGLIEDAKLLISSLEYPVLTAMIQSAIAISEDARVETQQAREQVLAGMLLLCSVSLVLTIIFGFLFGRTIVKPLKFALSAAEEIRDGERSVRFPKTMNSDEIGDLIQALKGMLEGVKGSEALIERAREYAMGLLQGTPIPLLVIDENSKIVTLANQAFTDTYGEEGILQGKSIFEIGNGYWNNTEFRDYLQSTRLYESALPQREFAFDDPKSSLARRFLHLRASRLKDPIKNHHLLLLAILDMTPFRKAEKDLIETRTQAEEASKAKTFFLAKMSHEIRTPLNAIIGMADLLTETQLSPDQKRYVEIFERSGNTLLSIVNDILDFAKIERGEVTLIQESFHLVDTVESVIQLLSVKAYEKHLDIGCYVSPRCPEWLTGDAQRFRQILMNLVGNAVKFTHYGEVFVHVEAKESDAAGNVELEVSICDTGIGIPIERIDSVFEQFRQAEASIGRKYGGTGLGLAICKQLVELMGGHIYVTSELGKGSVFKFEIPFLPEAKSEEVSRHDFVAPKLNGKKIIVVDSNPSQRRVLERYLKHWGADVESYESFDELTPKTSFEQQNFFLCDLERLPLSMKQLLQQLLKFEGSHVIPIAIRSPLSRVSENLQKELGIEFFVLKPIQRKELARVFLSLEQDNVELIQKPKKIQPDPFLNWPMGPPKILLAEDSPENKVILKSYLKDLNLNLDFAENGEVAYVKRKEENYDVILMDLDMPVKDGYQAFEDIRQWEKENRKPASLVIALTAYAFGAEREKCMKMGFNGYLTKPIRKRELIEALHAELQNSHAAKKLEEESLKNKSSHDGDAGLNA